ncbi:hypothetical protein M1M11_29830 [Pseudomonas azerbaijanoccidens]|uniref:hypothetical protein n=1 Tax=Pseudomonas azerbaijanoccidentalis TaxID=2842347 RepID=UPI00200A935E|nr:hypothetical protein [Pseudomonas azerbaijanoccidentalis]MCK8669081.1 hypothetical protein [Pseudomonas azerbaijanoccidentalis]
MTQKRFLDDQAHAMLVQQHQLDQTNTHLDNMLGSLSQMAQDQRSNDALLDSLLAQAQSAVDDQDIVFVVEEQDIVIFDDDWLAEPSNCTPAVQPLALLDIIDIDADGSTYLEQVESYAARHDIVFAQDPFRDLMTDSQRIALEKRIKDEFSIKAAACDKYDYMIAGTCGLIGGLVDVLFVGVPGKGALGKWADDQTDKAVQGFAKLNGWKGPGKPGQETASAIGFLEKKFPINYDHSTTHATDGAVKNMSMKNHHVKSLGHSPDLVGLFFSILDQFNNTAHFVDKGKLISIDTKTFELSGSNVVAKVFAGFMNWLGHLFSDMAGSSGGRGKVDAGRGSGIPMPFYSLLQFINVGAFGQHRQTFSTIAVKVFESGYDLRHGLAMAIPVLITELLTRMMWVIKQRFYHQQDWRDCIPSAGNPELRRMLLIGHGTLCLIDTTDAALRSGGNIVAFMLRSNLLAWARFGTLAIKEVKACYMAGSLDVEAVDAYLDAEYERLTGS